MSEITVYLVATEPMELMREETIQNVWFRNNGMGGNVGWDEIEVRGNPLDVYDFIVLHWSVEEAKAKLNV